MCINIKCNNAKKKTYKQVIYHDMEVGMNISATQC